MWNVQTGAEIRSWDLPFGFLDQMAFQTSDRLLLVRDTGSGKEAHWFRDGFGRSFRGNRGLLAVRIRRMR